MAKQVDIPEFLKKPLKEKVTLTVQEIEEIQHTSLNEGIIFGLLAAFAISGTIAISLIIWAYFAN